ncbi:hypothetical protein TWF788_004846 [Orbilia oligospora]|uniref:3'-5' exonuclease domain-containing protein n=1 Tax=Orbilia oligospora TaxID=2813651 RepID=A0A7C8U152_ORBOL|nr:hypothetical protein TWF788_004846 [Orbilia oligospora]
MPQSQVTFVQTTEQVSQFLSCVPLGGTNVPSIYIDLEGVNLSRHGYISLLQIFLFPLSQNFILDIHTLGHSAFTTSSPDDPSRTFKSILEDPDIPIVCYDIRADNDALYNLYSISVANVIDLQLLELATRHGSRRLLNGLSRSIQYYPILSASEKYDWVQIKERGRRLFAPERGGRYEIFNSRPLPDDLLEYCVQDVQHLQKLWQYFNSKLENMDSIWRQKIRVETERRISLCRDPDFQAKDRGLALGPISFRI